MVKRVEFGQNLMRALRRQRMGLGAAVSAGILLIGVFHAPAVPVLVGCTGALAFLLVKGWHDLP